MLLQVKSGGLGRGDVDREAARMGMGTNDRDGLVK